MPAIASQQPTPKKGPSLISPSYGLHFCCARFIRRTDAAGYVENQPGGGTLAQDFLPVCILRDTFRENARCDELERAAGLGSRTGNVGEEVGEMFREG